MIGASDVFTIAMPLTFVAAACWEARRPARVTTTSLSLRWFGNIGLFAIALVLGRFLPFLSSYEAAEVAHRRHWGLFTLMGPHPTVALALGFIVLDFAAYWTHRLFHGVPLLWRLHAVHHSDSDLDVTTTIRHHPLEALAQMLMDTSIAVVLGVPGDAIVAYAGVVTIVQTFNHGNVLVFGPMRWMNSWLMTPDLHRLHHSVLYGESNSNFGNLVPLWDRLFATFRSQPEGTLRVGLPEFGPNAQSFGALLLQPLSVAVATSGMESAPETVKR